MDTVTLPLFDMFGMFVGNLQIDERYVEVLRTSNLELRPHINLPYNKVVAVTVFASEVKPKTKIGGRNVS